MDPTQGNGAPEAPHGDAPKGITSDEVNRAITARFKAFESRIDKLFEERFSALAPPKNAEDEPKEKSSKGLDEHPEFQKLARQTQRLQEQLAQAQKERDAEKAHARDVKLRTELANMLADAGIDGARGKHAVGYLVDADKRVVWDGDAIAFRGSDNELLPVGEGLKSWLSTDDAKLYLPPRGAVGSGERSNVGGRVNAQADAQSSALEAIRNHFGLT